MSSPSFLLANDSNHNLLRALLEAMNSVIEHQYNSKLFYTEQYLGSQKFLPFQELLHFL
jgi:hypothetical protein